MESRHPADRMMGCFYFGGTRRTWAWETPPHVQSLDISSLLKGLELISHFLNTGHRAVVWPSLNSVCLACLGVGRRKYTSLRNKSEPQSMGCVLEIWSVWNCFFMNWQENSQGNREMKGAPFILCQRCISQLVAGPLGSQHWSSLFSLLSLPRHPCQPRCHCQFCMRLGTKPEEGDQWQRGC